MVSGGTMGYRVGGADIGVESWGSYLACEECAGLLDVWFYKKEGCPYCGATVTGKVIGIPDGKLYVWGERKK